MKSGPRLNMSACDNTHNTRKLARDIRGDILRMIYAGKCAHVGGCLSLADILAVLYGRILNVDARHPDHVNRDRVILSKGHAAAAYYAVLAEQGFFPREWLKTYYKNDSPLGGHVTYGVPGVDVSSGSLGHGLSLGCGMALSGKMDKRNYRTFVLLGDGECDEGSVWEAALFASHHQLDNLIAIIDYNKIQSFGTVKEVLGMEPFDKKWESFGWATISIDGHDIDQIEETLRKVPFTGNKPSCVIAHTVKGKGISFMENKLDWHYRTPDEQQFKAALRELGMPE